MTQPADNHPVSNPSYIAQLADDVHTGRLAKGTASYVEFVALAIRNGYTQTRGGYIRPRMGADPITRGWAAFVALVLNGTVPFKSGSELDYDDWKAAWNAVDVTDTVRASRFGMAAMSAAKRGAYRQALAFLDEAKTAAPVNEVTAPVHVAQAVADQVVTALSISGGEDYDEADALMARVSQDTKWAQAISGEVRLTGANRAAATRQLINRRHGVALRLNRIYDRNAGQRYVGRHRTRETVPA